jgi:glutathione S-transferase
LKPTEPFRGGGMPIFHTKEGKRMGQSRAIYNYIARQNGYYPADPELSFPCNFIMETYYDYYDKLVFLSPPTEEDLKAVFEERIPKMLAQFKPWLENDCKFLLTDELTMCDFVLGTFYTDLVTNPLAYGREQYAKVLEDYPAFKKFGETYKAELGDYVDSRAPAP